MKPAYFAQKYIRLLTKTASAIELGPSVCWMLSIIATQEDAKRYTEPAKWYYEQLMPLCGFTSRKQLSRAINRAVEFGWLEYTPGRKGKPCYFRTQLPDRYRDLDHGACDESQPDSVPESELKKALNDKCRSRIGTIKETKGKRKGRTSIPSPTPSPDTFDEWYAIYPRKVAKKAARQAYANAVQLITNEEHCSTDEAAEKLLAWTKERLDGLKEAEPKFRPHPATWLNQGRYRDELDLEKQAETDAEAKTATQKGSYKRKPKRRAGQ